MSGTASRHHDPRVVAVVGGRGQQGGSVIHALLQRSENQYRVRTLTRADSSDIGVRELQSKGVDVVFGNINDSNSLKKLFSGAYAAFAVTAPFDGEHSKNSMDEVEQGKLMAEIAAEEGVQVYIWSTLANCMKISNSKYSVKHFTDKALVDQYIRNQNFNFTYISVLPACYFENFLNYLAPTEVNDTYVFHLPAKSSGVWSVYSAVNDTGEIVRKILENPGLYANKIIDMVAERLTLDELIKRYGEVRGRRSILHELTDEEFLDSMEGARETLSMFRFFDEFGYGDQHESNEIDGKEVYPQLTTWKQWLEKQFT